MNRGVDFAEPYMADDPVQQGDENLSVRFFLRPVRKQLPPEPGDPSKPTQPLSKVKPRWADDDNGYPTYEDREYVSIRKLGDNLVEHVSPARDSHRRRFAKQYEAFKQGLDGAKVGFPLAEWPPITRSEVEELALRRVYTVEQLASSNPDALGIERGHPLVVRAKAFLAAAKDGAHVTQMTAALEERDALIKQLQEQAEQQGQALSKLLAERSDGESEAPARPRRPPPDAKRASQ